MSQLLRKGLSAAVVFCFAVFGVSALSAQVVATYDFEDGTTQGWVSFYNASTPVNSTAAAESGTHSLLTSTSSSGTGGPSINETSLLLPGGSYTITGYVMLGPGATSANANFTIARTDSTCGGGTCYDTIGPYQVAVNASGWAQIGGAYTVPSTATGLLLYAQLVGATSAVPFYLDNVVITETAAPPVGTPVVSYTFGDGGTDGWFTFGSFTLSNATSPLADPNGDTHSLLAAGRTAGYMGPGLNVLPITGIVPGATYAISAYVMLATADSGGPTVSMSTQRNDCSGTTYNTLATSAPLSNTAWTHITGSFSFSDIPGAPASLILYFQSSSATDSFYLSDVAISQTIAAPNPSAQDNTGLSTNFEDGGTDGWFGRGATVTNTTAAAHTGSHSLLVSGRTSGNWNGPAINVSNKMYNGSQYAISVWVQMVPQDGSTHIINMSLQITYQGNVSYPGVNGYPGASIPADGQWHLISIPNYNMSSNYDTNGAALYLQTFPASGNDFVSFYVDDFQLTYIPPPVIQSGIPSLYQSLEWAFPVGAAVDPTDLSGPHRDLLYKHFNSIVSGNDMKWSSVENTKGSFTYGTADQEVALAKCGGMLMRGHNLVWATGAQTPGYAFGDGTNSAANQATVTANIQEHIQNEVQHFGTNVYVWDVVNEPLDPNQPDCLVHGPFYQVLGKSYIDIALQAARQYAPAGTKLFINDYSTTDPGRLSCLVKVVQDLRSRGIPIDGVGHEMHNAVNHPSVSAIVNAITTMYFTVPGIEQQVTELDMSVYPAGDNTSNFGANGGTVPLSIIAQQGYVYAQYFHAFRALRGMLSGVTFWGIADDDTWLDSFPIARLNLPLVFDTGLQAKPAYWGIIDPSHLPGYGLQFTVSKTGPLNARVWTVTATNPSANGPAYATQINGFGLTAPRGGFRRGGFGGTVCSPVITPPTAFPVVLGDVASGTPATAQFTINFSGCPASAHFSLDMPWSSANGADTGALVLEDQLP